MGVADPFFVARAAGLELTGKSEGLTLTDGTMELRADYTRMLPRLKPVSYTHLTLPTNSRV